MLLNTQIEQKIRNVLNVKDMEIKKTYDSNQNVNIRVKIKSPDFNGKVSDNS